MGGVGPIARSAMRLLHCSALHVLLFSYLTLNQKPVFLLVKMDFTWDITGSAILVLRDAPSARTLAKDHAVAVRLVMFFIMVLA